MSRCDVCGILCEAFPVFDAASLGIYSSNNCSVIVGDLHISELPIDLGEFELSQGFQGVSSIRGFIYVSNNPYLTSLSFLSQVVSVSGVTLFNNPNMVDARLPSLFRLSEAFTAEGCDRLCPQRYTSAIIGADESFCANLTVSVALSYLGDSNANAASLAYDLFAKILSEISNAMVNFCFQMFLHDLMIAAFSGTEPLRLKLSKLGQTGRMLLLSWTLLNQDHPPILKCCIYSVNRT